MKKMEINLRKRMVLNIKNKINYQTLNMKIILLTKLINKALKIKMSYKLIK